MIWLSCGVASDLQSGSRKWHVGVQEKASQALNSVDIQDQDAWISLTPQIWPGGGGRGLLVKWSIPTDSHDHQGL